MFAYVRVRSFAGGERYGDQDLQAALLAPYRVAAASAAAGAARARSSSGIPVSGLVRMGQAAAVACLIGVMAPIVAQAGVHVFDPPARTAVAARVSHRPVAECRRVRVAVHGRIVRRPLCVPLRLAKSKSGSRLLRSVIAYRLFRSLRHLIPYRLRHPLRYGMYRRPYRLRLPWSSQ